MLAASKMKMSGSEKKRKKKKESEIRNTSNFFFVGTYMYARAIMAPIMALDVRHFLHKTCN